MVWKIWLLVPLIYTLFSLWYFNWQGALTPVEIDRFMAAFEELEGNKDTD